MTFSPFQSDLPLICYIDYKSPYAFVAKDPTYALADSLGIQVDWRPITLDIPSYLGSAKLDKQDRVVENNRTPQQWTGVKYAYRDARRYAALNGYTLRGTVKIWDTSLIHIAMLWVKQQDYSTLKRFTDQVYERFWRRELDVEDLPTVVECLRNANAETTGFEQFAGHEGRTLHDSMQAAIFAAGIYGVPTYIVDEEMFFGREHLPMIAWILKGRHGVAPDIAYGPVI
ncbi:MAG: DsbA family protein [Proteobacteria bacterium]|nr:DsbA family protein [Pseudomonadota bacterium]